MRVLIIDKTAVLAANHERYKKIAAHSDIELAVLSPIHWHEHMHDVRVEKTSDPNYRIFLGKTLWSGSYSHGFYWRGLGQAIRRFKPDLIQLLEEPWSFFAGQTARLASRLAPQAQLLFYTWENILRHGSYCSRLDPIHRRIEQRVFCQSCAGICATQTAERVLKERGFQGKTEVIPYGIPQHFILPEEDLEEKLTRPIPEAPRIGYIGRLLEMKGVETLIQALPEVPGRLVILGSGLQEMGLRMTAQIAGVSDRIEWLPAVPPEAVIEHLSSLDVLVLPSRTTPVWAEQLGRVLLEAMGSGVSVIGSSSGCIPEVIGESGYIFEEGNPGSLAQALLRVFGDQADRNERRRNGWEKVRSRYTWDRFAGDLAGVFRGILTNKPFQA